MTRVPSFTFAGGVISEDMWGRPDLNKYQTGLRYADNFTLGVGGGIDKRFGTYYTGKRKDQSHKSKLIPWRIADDDSYMLEFGLNYIRFIRFGGYVTIPGGHVADPDSIAVNVGGFMEVPTPWLAQDVAELKYTFANDIMYISHQSQDVHQLRRLGLYDWSLVPQGFDPHPNWSGAVTATYFDDTTPDDNYVVEPVPTHYKISATLSDGTETKPSPAVTVDADLGHRRTRVELDWPNYVPADPDLTVIQYTIYKGANGIYGFIGYSDTSDYIDRNFAPSYDVVPVGKRLSLGNENPAVIEFYKQRMAYANTETHPQDMWISQPLLFNSLNTSVPLQDDDAFQLPLVGRQRHTINHMLMLKKFLIFTDSAEWVMNTVENQALTAASADPTIETYYGAHPYLRPISIGSRVLFVQNKTGSVMDMGYEFTSDAFKADDLSRLARDLFKSNPIVAWDYATHPKNILVCVLEDGTLAIMTYVREDQIWGWTTSSTMGKFIDVACVTEFDHEGIYFQVERVINGVKTYFIERMEINFNGLVDDMVYADCALRYVDSRSTEIVWDSVDQIKVDITGGYAMSIGDKIRIEIGSDVYIGAATAFDGDTITLEPVDQTGEFPESIDGLDAQALLMISTITGFSHLEGMPVDVLADGKVYKNKVISSGGFTLPIPAARVVAGLHYDTFAEVLDIDTDPAKALFLEKTVHEITLNLRASRGVWVGVPNGGPLEELKNRNSSENMFYANEVLNGPFNLSPFISWEQTTNIRVESRDPLPCNVRNICPDIRYGS